MHAIDHAITCSSLRSIVFDGFEELACELAEPRGRAAELVCTISAGEVGDTVTVGVDAVEHAVAIGIDGLGHTAGIELYIDDASAYGHLAGQGLRAWAGRHAVVVARARVARQTAVAGVHQDVAWGVTQPAARARIPASTARPVKTATPRRAAHRATRCRARSRRDRPPWLCPRFIGTRAGCWPEPAVLQLMMRGLRRMMRRPRPVCMAASACSAAAVHDEPAMRTAAVLLAGIQSARSWPSILVRTSCWTSVRWIRWTRSGD